MTEALPRLDDRAFADLMREAEALIRRKAPGWTDLSPGDPGITLIEVFAYLTDVLLYRLNRVPAKVHVALIDLLGVKQLAPAAATVRLTFSRDAEEGGGPLSIPAGTRVSDASGEVTFETLADATLADEAIEVPAINAELIWGETIGTGTGEAGQQMALKRPPPVRNADIDWVLAIGVEASGEIDRTTTVVSDRGKAFVIWREVGSFFGLAATDQVFVADRASGRITFGPAGTAAVPGRGREVRAWYRRGGGRGGNVAAGTLTALVAPLAGVSVTNKDRAVGGEDAETAAEVVTRGREAVRVLRTAVTARDFERVALEVGGIARARASALREIWSFARPGVVDIQLVPRIDRSALPDGGITPAVLAEHQRAELLDRVERAVRVRRPLGVETQHSFTKCRPVSVSARVVVSRAEAPAQVAERLRRRLNDLLSPQGHWPHGKILRASDVYEALLAEPSVRYAEGVRLSIDRAPSSDIRVLTRDPHSARSLFVGTADALFRAEDLGRGFEMLDLGTAQGAITSVAIHPEKPGAIAVSTEDAGSIHRVLISEDVGDSWRIADQLQNEPIYDIAWLASRIGRPVLFLATRKALRRLEPGTGGGSNNLPDLTADGQAGGNGFFAIATARHPMDVSFVAVAARELGGVLVSRQGGAKRSFEPIPGSSGKDIRILKFQTVGDRMFLWAGIAAAAGKEGEGLMRIEARADGIDPGGWAAYSKGWRGGSCEGFDIVGSMVVAGSNRAGVLTLDLSVTAPTWSVATLDSGLPINNERSALLPITAVGLVPGGRQPTTIAGADAGLYVAREGIRFEREGQTVFTDAVPLPRTWLYCSGSHRLDVVTDAEATEATS